jgi:hypothetical protein
MPRTAPIWISTARQVRLSMPRTSAAPNPERPQLSSCRYHRLIRTRFLLRISGCSDYFRIGDYPKAIVLSCEGPHLPGT